MTRRHWPVQNYARDWVGLARRSHAVLCSAGGDALFQGGWRVEISVGGLGAGSSVVGLIGQVSRVGRPGAAQRKAGATEGGPTNAGDGDPLVLLVSISR